MYVCVCVCVCWIKQYMCVVYVHVVIFFSLCRRTMIKTLSKGIVVAVVSAIALPYTVAILCNVLYGWPRKNKFQRAFHPRKVYSLNYTVLQHLMRIKYLGLLFRWKCFYKKASRKRLVKVKLRSFVLLKSSGPFHKDS